MPGNREYCVGRENRIEFGNIQTATHDPANPPVHLLRGRGWRTHANASANTRARRCCTHFETICEDARMHANASAKTRAHDDNACVRTHMQTLAATMADVCERIRISGRRRRRRCTRRRERGREGKRSGARDARNQERKREDKSKRARERGIRERRRWLPMGRSAKWRQNEERNTNAQSHKPVAKS